MKPELLTMALQVSGFKPGDSVLVEGAVLPSAMWVDHGKRHHY